MRRWMCLLAAPALLAASVTREMSLKTPDGYTLKGTLSLPDGKGRKPVVLLAHQFRSDRKGWEALVSELHARGMGTLAVDLRGHGESLDKAGSATPIAEDFAASAKTVGFERIPDDLVLAAQWLRKQPGVLARRLGVAGSSLGAFSALLAAPRIRPDAVLALSPAGSIAFAPQAQAKLKDAVQRSGAAVFVLSSEEDGDAADSLKALKGLPGVHVELLPGKDHGFAYLPARKDTMAVFFGEYLHHPHRARFGAIAPRGSESPCPAPVERIP